MSKAIKEDAPQSEHPEELECHIIKGELTEQEKFVRHVQKDVADLTKSLDSRAKEDQVRKYLDSKGIDIHTADKKTINKALSSQGLSIDIINGIHQITGTPNTQYKGSMVTVVPPFNQSVLLGQLLRNTRLRKAASMYARNSYGLGYEIVPKDTKDLNDPTLSELIKEETKMLRSKLDNISEVPFQELLYQQGFDEEATGQGYVEVIRDTTYNIVELKNVPPHTVLVSKDGMGYVQTNQNMRVFFKKLGDEQPYNKLTGVRMKNRKRFNNKDTANELIMFKIYAPESTFYGIPRWVASTQAVLGNWLCAERNVSFFDNDTVPRMAVLVSGATINKEGISNIERFFKKNQGAENSNRVIIIQASGKSQSLGVGQELKSSLELKPLTIGINEDGEFLKYKKANDDEILEAFGIHKGFFSSEDVNKANAEIGRKITNEQEFAPARQLREHQLNKLLLPELGADLCKIRLDWPKTLDGLDKANVDRMLSDMAAITVNEARIRNGLPPLPEDFEFGNYPWQVISKLHETSNMKMISGIEKCEEEFTETPDKSDKESTNSADKTKNKNYVVGELSEVFRKALHKDDITILVKNAGEVSEINDHAHTYELDMEKSTGKTNTQEDHFHIISKKSLSLGLTEESNGHTHKLEEFI